MLDKNGLILIEKDIQQALKEVGKKHGVSIKSSGGKWTQSWAELKVRIELLTQSGEVLTRESEEFKRYCGHYGLKPDHLGREFACAGATYTITGLKTTNFKSPILARHNGSGVIYKFTPALVLQKLNQIPQQDTDFDEPA